MSEQKLEGKGGLPTECPKCHEVVGEWNWSDRGFDVETMCYEGTCPKCNTTFYEMYAVEGWEEKTLENASRLPSASTLALVARCPPFSCRENNPGRHSSLFY